MQAMLHRFPRSSQQISKQVSELPGGSDSKVSVYNAGDPGSIPGLGRSPGEENGNPNSCLENPMDGGAWWATVQELDTTELLSSYAAHSVLEGEFLPFSSLVS